MIYIFYYYESFPRLCSKSRGFEDSHVPYYVLVPKKIRLGTKAQFITIDRSFYQPNFKSLSLKYIHRLL